jgi:hypothetical protein
MNPEITLRQVFSIHCATSGVKSSSHVRHRNVGAKWLIRGIPLQMAQIESDHTAMSFGSSGFMYVTTTNRIDRRLDP